MSAVFETSGKIPSAPGGLVFGVPGSSPPPSGFTSMAVGVNMDVGGDAQFSSTGYLIFQDAFKKSRGFQNTAFSSQYTVANGNLSSAGWPLTDFGALITEGSASSQSWNASGQVYSCGFVSNGSGTETITGANGASVSGKSYNSSTKVLTFNLVSSGSNTGVTVTGTTGGVTNFYANVQGATISGYQLAAVPTASAIAFYKQFNHIRLVFYLNTINNTATMSASTQSTALNTRAYTGWNSSGTDGYPKEWVMDLVLGIKAAGGKTGLWINLPIVEDGTNGTAGTYTTAVANLLFNGNLSAGGVTAGIPTGVPIYIEIGNEIWNYSSQNTPFTSQASAAGLTIQQWMGKRYHDAAVIFQSVFGSRYGTDVKMVMMSGPPQINNWGWGMLAAQYQQTTYGGPYFHGLGYAPYFGPSPTGGSAPASIAAIESYYNTAGQSIVTTSLSETIAISGMHYGGFLAHYEDNSQQGEDANTFMIPALKDSSSTNLSPAGWRTVMDNHYQAVMNAGCAVTTHFQDGIYIDSANDGWNWGLYDNYANIANSPTLLALQDTIATGYAPTRNVVNASGVTISGGNYNDHIGASSPTLSGSFASGCGPHPNIAGYVGWVLHCTRPATYALNINVTGSGNTNTEYGAPGNPATINTNGGSHFSLTAGANACGNIVLVYGPNYLVLGIGTAQSGVTINSFTLT
jgi:hypothetical protein